MQTTPHAIEALKNLLRFADLELTFIFTHPEGYLNSEQVAILAELKKTIDELYELLENLKDA